MKRIEAIIRVNKLEEVKRALEEAGAPGMSVEQVRGFGRQQGQHEQFRGSNYALNLVPKTRIEAVVPDDLLEDCIDAIIEAASTGELGDGKIFVTEVLEAVRVRTGERGEDALN
ncbi:MAG TPA: P-II family nitrogen regulator [Fimbriimonadaceae bacterium]|nr:P-II family nitrogen regulator [Fimbriimonadaceae bacterium]